MGTSRQNATPNARSGMLDAPFSRRALAKAGCALVGAGVLASTATAARAEQADSYTFADTVEWSAEYDVVVLGMGFAGLVSAMEAADNGASVLICEKGEAGVGGGNSRVCSQMFAWGGGDASATLDYYTALAGGRSIDPAILQLMAKGVADLGDTLADKYGLDKSAYVQGRTAEYPEFAGAESIGLWKSHDAQDDSFVYQAMMARLGKGYADKIDVWYASPATSLIQDPESKTVIGVTVDRRGETRNVRAANGVVVCTGGFENNPQMVQDYLGVVNYAVRGSFLNTGDGIRMCQEIGARMWHMCVWECHTMTYLACGYVTDDQTHGTRTSFPAEGSVIMVGTLGKRFGNETYTTRHGHVTDGNNLWENIHYPNKIFAVWDQAQMDALEEGSRINEDYRDTIVACASIEEAAGVIGCPAENLRQTIEDFNGFAESGRDYEFDRDPEKMRALNGETLYVMPMKTILLNTQGGPERNASAEVIGLDGEPIPHLYSAGECGGSTVCMYQGGGNVAECFVYGQVAGASAAAPKTDELPAYSALPRVDSTPAHLGDETDLAPEGAAVEVPEGALAGTAQGIGGELVVSVTLGSDNAIASVEVVSHNETEGIGTKAIDAMPAKFVGLSTAEEIDGVDGVSGATVTSSALRAAVKNALGL